MDRKIFGDKDVSCETLGRLRIFESLVKKWNKAINLVSRGDFSKIWERHILDSAQIYPYLPKSPSIYSDFGSGGGFPSIVLATLLYGENSSVKIHLIESDGRKAAFLRTVLRDLKIPGTVWGERVEEVNLPPASILSARAVAPLKDLPRRTRRPHIGILTCDQSAERWPPATTTKPTLAGGASLRSTA